MKMKSVDRLISLFRRFPGVGPKQAERFALYAIRVPEGEIENLVQALRSVKNSVGVCAVCCNYSEDRLCAVCADGSRDHSLICVVSNPQDVSAIEKTGSYSGVYHVLHGAISPAEGFTSASIKLRELEAKQEESEAASAAPAPGGGRRRSC